MHVSSNACFVSEVVAELGRRYEQDGLESLSAPQKVVFLTWCAKGAVDNGGFQFLYEGDLPIMEVASAFEEIGLPEAAQACRGSSAISHDGTGAERGDRFRPFDTVIWNLDSSEGEDRLLNNLSAYIRLNADDFDRANVTPSLSPGMNSRGTQAAHRTE